MRVTSVYTVRFSRRPHATRCCALVGGNVISLRSRGTPLHAGMYIGLHPPQSAYRLARRCFVGAYLVPSSFPRPPPPVPQPWRRPPRRGHPLPFPNASLRPHPPPPPARCAPTSAVAAAGAPAVSRPPASPMGPPGAARTVGLPSVATSPVRHGPSPPPLPPDLCGHGRGGMERGRAAVPAPHGGARREAGRVTVGRRGAAAAAARTARSVCRVLGRFVPRRPRRHGGARLSSPPPPRRRLCPAASRG